jgi:hypothetical protein
VRRLDTIGTSLTVQSIVSVYITVNKLPETDQEVQERPIRMLLLYTLLEASVGGGNM